VLRALRAGAAWFLVKPTPPEDLIGLVQVAAEGHTVLSPAAARRLIVASAGQQPARDRARHLAGSLTDREAQVLACLGEGLSNAQIAARLYLSEARVKGYVWRMLDKLGCANRAQAGLLATPRYRQPVARVGEAAGWNSGRVPGRPGCVLRPDVRARRVRRASRARRESAAVAIMSLTRSAASCCRISGCMGSSWVRRAAAGCRAGRSSCRGTIRRSDRPGGR
jgi:DNA-binding CsgD family transcriptional regulator